MRRLTVLVLLVVLAAAAPASAAVIGGTKWPGKVIRYHVSGSSAPAVDAAAKAWNRTGLRIRFERAPKGRAALLVRTDRKMGCAGFAQVGYLYPGGGWVRMGDCRGHEWPLTQIAAHELGHTLGLDHETRRCALMNTSIDNGAPNQCKPPASGRYRCRLFERDDLDALKRLYGGRLHDRGPANCPLFAAPGAVAGLTATAQDGTIELAYGLPDAPRPVVDEWFARPDQQVEVAAAAGACPSSPAGLFAARDRTRDAVYRWGGRQTSSLPIAGAGPHCVAVRLTDALGRSGPVATTTVTVAPPPVEASISADGYGVAGTPMAFDAYASSEDPVTAYAWDFGDPASGAANRATGPSPFHTFAQPGTYTVTLEVRTSRGATAVATQEVTIDPPYDPGG